MKLRQNINDFRVEEVADHKISDKGSHKLYSLEKVGLESFSLINYLSSKNHIPVSEFGIAGLKDRYAITKQYFTIPSKYDIKTMKEKNFTITFLGFTDDPVKLKDLEANRFVIVVRDIKNRELQSIYDRAKSLEKEGVPNYFDSQRFGSVIEKQFIAKHIINKDYESALRCFLTLYTKYESKRIKDDKRLIADNWNNLDKIKVQNRTFSEIIAEYNKTKSWLSAYKKIPSRLREMFVSAYQSYLWNECIKELLREKVRKNHIYGVKYNIGALLFYNNLTDEELKIIPESFVKISDDMSASEEERRIVDKILSREGLTIDKFSIKKETGSFFKGTNRSVIVKPIDFKISDAEPDELNKGSMSKIKVSFSLPTGSYATIVTKRIFGN